MDAIEVRDLRKSYGAHAVLKGISLTVRRGEIFALLGTNGAGKTTTLECIEGLRRPDSGSIAVRGKTGIQLQSASLPAYIKAMEAVRLFAEWNRTPVCPPMLKALGVQDFAKQRYGRLSTGQKRRLHLALALLGDPDILFLDEPTAGLDVEGRVSLHGQIRQLRAQGKTLVLASHDMAEVESLCDRLAIIHGGEVAFTGSVEELDATLGKRYRIQIQTDAGSEKLESEDIGETLLTRLEEYREAGRRVLDIRIDRGTLEEHFMRMTGR